MIDLAHNINAFFGETGENTGVRGLLSRLGESENIPHSIAVTPDLFYSVADVFRQSDVRPIPLEADGAIDLSAVLRSSEKTRLFVISTANIETGVLTPIGELTSLLNKNFEAQIVSVETRPRVVNEELSRSLRDEMQAAILRRFPFAYVNGTAENRLPNVSNISFENMNGEVIAAMLFEKGFSPATGCACADASKRPSMTLREMNVPYSRVIGSMHFSFGHEFKKYEADQFIGILTEILEKVHMFSFE